MPTTTATTPSPYSDIPVPAGLERRSAGGTGTGIETSSASTYTYAQPGAIRPIHCAPWCTDGDGHPAASMRDDQVCWGPDGYVEASTEEVLAEFRNDSVISFPSVIGAQAYRQFNQQPQVYVHIELPAAADAGGVDVSVKLTADEARRLAANLIEAAELIGTESPQPASE
jgi:hypothetical protein